MGNISEYLMQLNNPASYISGVVIYILSIIAMWRIFTKADRSGWMSIIPFLNMYILCKIALGNGWWFLLLFVPIVNVIFYIYLNIKLAYAFGRGIGFAIGLILLNTIFILILGLGDSRYTGTDGELGVNRA